jgi:hypothetical protein
MIQYTMRGPLLRGGVPTLDNVGFVPRCNHPGCGNKKCFGNVIRIPVYGQQAAVLITWNHHKTDKGSKSKPISLRVQDPRVVSVLQYWYKWGHPLLYFGNPFHQPDKKSGCFLFMYCNTQSGLPEQHKDKGCNWAHWLKKHSTSKPGLGAHHVRHSWATILANAKVGDFLATRSTDLLIVYLLNLVYLLILVGGDQVGNHVEYHHGKVVWI